MANPINAATLAKLQTARRAAVAEPLARSLRGPETAPPVTHDAITRIVQDQMQALITSIWKQGNFMQIPFVVGTGVIQLRPAEPRRYVFIQNQSGANQLIVGIGKPPGAAGTIPVDGLIVGPNFGFYEPLCVPQDAIWIVGSAGNTAGMLFLAS